MHLKNGPIIGIPGKTGQTQSAITKAISLFFLPKPVQRVKKIKKYINYTPEEKATDYSLIGKTILIQPIHRNAYMYGSDMVMFDAAGNLDIYYTNYIQTGNWYNIDSILTDEELQKIQEDVYDELGITETTE